MRLSYFRTASLVLLVIADVFSASASQKIVHVGCLGRHKSSTTCFAMTSSLKIRNRIAALRASSSPVEQGLCSRRAAIAGVLFLPALLGNGRIAEAKGEFAKIDVGKMVEDYNGVEKKGPSLYDAESDKIRQTRLASIKKEWVKLVKEVDSSLAINQCMEAKGALGLRMGTIKGYMREVSRLVAGGDILVRDRGEDKSANFDYSSGTFEYKAVAQLPEDMFGSINRLVENCRLKDPEGAMGEWVVAKDIFSKWEAMVQ